MTRQQHIHPSRLETHLLALELLDGCFQHSLVLLSLGAAAGRFLLLSTGIDWTWEEWGTTKAIFGSVGGMMGPQPLVAGARKGDNNDPFVPTSSDAMSSDKDVQ